VRPRVQIPGPRPFLYSKSAISGVVQSRRGRAGAQILQDSALSPSLGVRRLKNGCASDLSTSTLQLFAHSYQLGLGLNMQLRICVSNMSFDSSFPDMQYATNVRRRMPTRR